MTMESVNRIDQFMLMHSTRTDKWRGVSIQAEEWATGQTGRPALEDAVAALGPIESFHAFPGSVSFAILRDRQYFKVLGTAGFDGTQFKGILANEYGIQVNKSSRNSVLVQSNINNTRSDGAHLIRFLVDVCDSIEKRLAAGGESARQAFADRVKSLMTDVPDLPNFSRFHDRLRNDTGKSTPEGDICAGFFGAYNAAGCDYVPLFGAECDRRLREGPEMLSANFVIPYPPSFPIMVPGQS
jgi:hypothetical protein